MAKIPLHIKISGSYNSWVADHWATLSHITNNHMSYLYVFLRFSSSNIFYLFLCCKQHRYGINTMSNNMYVPKIQFDCRMYLQFSSILRAGCLIKYIFIRILMVKEPFILKFYEKTNWRKLVKETECSDEFSMEHTYMVFLCLPDIIWFMIIWKNKDFTFDFLIYRILVSFLNTVQLSSYLWDTDSPNWDESLSKLFVNLHEFDKIQDWYWQNRTNRRNITVVEISAD